MPKNPHSLFALPVRWTGGPFAANVTDSGGVLRSVNLIGSSTLWTRTYLAPSTGGTSETAPTDLLRYVEAALNAAPGSGTDWSISLTAAGLVSLYYGGSGTGAIVWTTSTAIRNALGFTGNVSIATGTSVTATRHPAFCWLPYSLEGDPGWQPEPSLLVSSKLSTGQEIVWSEGTQELERMMRARFCPATEAIRISRNVYGTPYYPPADEPTRWTVPSIVPTAVASTGWTVHETLSVAPGLRVAMALYDLQQLIANTSTRYTVGAILADSTRNRGDRAALTVPAYTSMVDVPSFAVSYTTSETR